MYNRKKIFHKVCNLISTGDEVIEWNGQSLYGKSAQEVDDIIDDSKHKIQVKLIVSRVIGVNRRQAQASWRQSHSPTRLQRSGIIKTKQRKWNAI